MQTPQHPPRPTSPPPLVEKAKLNFSFSWPRFYLMSGEVIKLERAPLSQVHAMMLIRKAISIPSKAKITLFEKDTMCKVEGIIACDEVYVVITEGVSSF